MVFRCWSCGCHFSDGPPPLEALSPVQAEVVGSGYRGDPGFILCEQLKNMSVYNFCSVCVRFVHLQRVWEDDLEHIFIHPDQRPKRTDPEGNPSCTCGFVYEVPDVAYGSWRWIWINRATRLHRARELGQPFDDTDINLMSEV